MKFSELNITEATTSLLFLLIINAGVAGGGSLACITNPCVYGICIESNSLVSSSSIGSYTCYCIDGFTGVNCQTNWDECWSSPCLNGGSCIDGIAHFNCTCPDGFVGDTCEENINECGSNPCMNNGTCLDVANGYTCSCQPGYSGFNCEMDMAVCNTTEDTRCSNGGLCVEGPGVSFSCRCLPGWTGNLCQTPFDECSSSPCENGGVCIDMHAMYVCACPYGYTGTNCETQVELCSVNTCENNALCVIEGRSSVCYCVPDYHGDRCQLRYDECLKGPGCLNGGSCVDGVDSYSCSCHPSYTGRFCECQINPDGQFNCNYFYTVVPNVTQSMTETVTWAFTTSADDYTVAELSTFVPIDGTTSMTDSIPETDTYSTYLEEEERTGINEITTDMSATEGPEPFSPTAVFTSSPIFDLSSTSEFLQTDIFSTESSPLFSPQSLTSLFPFLTSDLVTQILPESNMTSVIEYSTDKPLASKADWTTRDSLHYTGMTEEPEITTTEQPANCFIIPCSNGGTCCNTTQGPQCTCNFGWKGKFCDEAEGIQIAAFKGRSYLLHVFGNTTKTSISLKIRTLADTGIVLYAHVSSSVYSTLYLQGGFLKFQFSCGIQTMLFSELKYAVNTGYEMDVDVILDLQPVYGIITRCNGTVLINGTVSMSGKQAASLPNYGERLHGALYIGGLSPQIVHQVDLPIRKGITACMHSLKVNNDARDIYSKALDGMDVTECESLACLSNPCLHGATCLEIGQQWNCLCPSGYIGETCQRSVCSNNPCKFGGTCVEYPGSGFLCLCPLGKHGMYCDEDLEIGHPHFSSSVSGLASFTAYPLPGAIHHSFELHFKFIPSTMDQISLMVFIGQGHPHDSSSDHLAVSFIKGYVVLTWNLGSGPRRIFTPQAILTSGGRKTAHTVRLGRSGQVGWIQVDTMPNVTGTSPGWLSQLNTRPIIYIGGHESRNFTGLPHDLPLHTGFSGCLFDLELRAGKVRLQLQRTKDAIGRNVGQCSTIHCHNSTCLNRGACIDHGATYACLCQDGWFGPGCALRYNPCDSTRNNCSAGSTCVPLAMGYECDCPLGRSGRFCEKDEKLSDVGFTGHRSYLSLAPAALDLTETCIDLEIRPISSQGLILFSSQTHGTSTTYLSLSLHGGVLELRLLPIGGQRRNGDPLIVRSGQILALSQWTRVRAGRYGKRIFLWVDGSINSGSLLPGEILLPSHTPLFIGGAPDLSKVPSSAVAGLPVAFMGCIRKLWINWRSVPLDEHHLIGGRNVQDCDGTACGGDICQNDGTCWVTPDNKAVCNCLPQYSGDHCEKQTSCSAIGCEHNGRCVKRGRASECHCPTEWTGPFCNKANNLGSPYFGGNSYLIVDSRRSMTKRDPELKDLLEKDPLDEGIFHFYINFSTAQHDGMILWTSKGTEFLGLGLETGMMKIVWGGSHSEKNEVLLPGTVMSDGNWHTLLVDYTGQRLIFWTDRIRAHSHSTNSTVRTNGVFFLGGFPGERRVIEETNGSFHSSFKGCIKELSWNQLLAIHDFSTFSGENIKSCDMSHI